jgi:hypothetical protein
MKTIANGIWLLGLGPILLLTSCGTKAPSTGPAYTYVIEADPNSLADATFQVDVLALNASTKKFYENVPIPDYFAMDSQVRKSAPVLKNKSLNMKAGSPQTINLDDPEYKTIRFPGYSYIGVFAYPPGDYHPADAKSDPRRVLLPLDPTKWQEKWPGKKREITIRITRDGGIQCDPSWIDTGP